MLYADAARAGVSPNKDPRRDTVKLFIVHHYASTQDPESAWRRFNSENDRSVSPNYQVNADGSVFEVVPPDEYRAWTTGSIDHQAVTCETQNTTGGPEWGISRASMEAIAQLVAWSADRYGFPIQRGRVADGNVVEVPGVVGHRETPAGRETSTSCPGPSMDLDWIVARAQEIGGGGPTPPAPEVEEDEMRVYEWAGHAFAVGDAVIYHLPTVEQLAEAEAEYGPRREKSNTGFGTLLLTKGIPWGAVDFVLRAPDALSSEGTSLKFWSRELAEGVAARGGQALAQKTLEEVLATAQQIAPPA